MKRSTLFIAIGLLFFFVQNSFAQKIKEETKDGKKYIIHKVQAKETVYKIAQNYKVSQEDLLKENPEIVNVLKVGALISVPNGDADVENPKLQSGNEMETQLVETKHTVQKGEWLNKIAEKYKVDVSELKKWNELTDEKIKPGQELIVGISTRKTKSKNLETKGTTALNTNKNINKNPKNLKASADDIPTFKIHKVAPKESLTILKKRYGVSIADIKEANNLTSDEINVGQELKIPVSAENAVADNTDENSLRRGDNNTNNSNPFDTNNSNTNTGQSNPFDTNSNNSNTNTGTSNPFDTNTNNSNTGTSNPFDTNTNNSNTGTSNPFSGNANNTNLQSNNLNQVVSDNPNGYHNQPATSQPFYVEVDQNTTIYKLQNQYNIRKTEIRYWNGMNPNDDNLILGKKIKIYQPRFQQHLVQAGETVESIAKNYHLHDGYQVRVWNKDKIKSEAQPTAGQLLNLYLPTGPTPPATFKEDKDKQQSNNQNLLNNNPNIANNNMPKVIEHPIKPNEYLYDIAQMYGVTPDEIKSWNGLYNNNLTPGNTLKIYLGANKPQINTNNTNNNSTFNPQTNKGTGTYNPFDANTNPFNQNANTTKTTGTNNTTLNSSNPFGNDPYNGLGQTTNPFGNADNTSLNRGNTQTNTNSDYSGTNTSKFLNDNPFNSNSTKTTNDYRPNNDYQSTLNTSIVGTGSQVIEKGLAVTVEDIPNAKPFSALHRSAPIGTLILVKNPLNGKTFVAEVVANINPINAKANVVIELTPTAYSRLGAINDKMSEVELSYIK